MYTYIPSKIIIECGECGSRRYAYLPPANPYDYVQRKVCLDCKHEEKPQEYTSGFPPPYISPAEPTVVKF